MQTSELIEKERQKEEKKQKASEKLERENIQTKPQYHLKP